MRNHHIKMEKKKYYQEYTMTEKIDERRGGVEEGHETDLSKKETAEKVDERQEKVGGLEKEIEEKSHDREKSGFYGGSTVEDIIEELSYYRKIEKIKKCNDMVYSYYNDDEYEDIDVYKMGKQKRIEDLIFDQLFASTYLLRTGDERYKFILSQAMKKVRMSGELSLNREALWWVKVDIANLHKSEIIPYSLCAITEDPDTLGAIKMFEKEKAKLTNPLQSTERAGPFFRYSSTDFIYEVFENMLINNKITQLITELKKDRRRRLIKRFNNNNISLSKVSKVVLECEMGNHERVIRETNDPLNDKINEPEKCTILERSISLFEKDRPNKAHKTALTAIENGWVDWNLDSPDYRYGQFINKLGIDVLRKSVEKYFLESPPDSHIHSFCRPHIVEYAAKQEKIDITSILNSNISNNQIKDITPKISRMILHHARHFNEIRNYPYISFLSGRLDESNMRISNVHKHLLDGDHELLSSAIKNYNPKNTSFFADVTHLCLKNKMYQTCEAIIQYVKNNSKDDFGNINQKSKSTLYYLKSLVYENVSFV